MGNKGAFGKQSVIKNLGVHRTRQEIGRFAYMEHDLSSFNIGQGILTPLQAFNVDSFVGPNTFENFIHVS